MSATVDAINSTPADRQDEPWLGLESYSEADAERFFGREAETAELLRLLRRDVLTVVFGPSGTGKTSLLKAGLFPKLRDEYFLPVAIRLDYSDKHQSLVSQVRAGITLACAHDDIEESFRGEGVLDKEETLWEYLHRAVFWDKRNNPITPVIVFDQFEEIFTLGHAHPAKGDFLTQLSDLIENYIPDTVREQIERTGSKLSFDAAEQHYKILIALREDFVSRLDSLRKAMPSVMHNRFALTRMDGEQALRPVLLPGGGIVSDAVAEQIVRKVASADPAIPLKDLAIDPALLSLMCRELNARRLREGRKTIAAELVNNAASDILIDFYERSFEGLNPQARKFVEDRLLTSEGFRTTVALDAAAREGLREDMEVLTNRRLIRAEERLGLPHLELTHDVLTKVALASRNEREERQRRAEEERRKSTEEAARRAELVRTRRVLYIVGTAGLFCLILAAIAFLFYRSAVDSANKAKLAEHEAEQDRRAAEDAKRTADSEKAQADLAAKDANDARHVSEEADSNLREVQRISRNTNGIGTKAQVSLLLSAHAATVSTEAEGGKQLDAIDLLRQQLAVIGGRPLLGPKKSTRVAAFSMDRHWMATGSDDGKLLLWNLSSPNPPFGSTAIGQLNGAVNGLAFSPDGKWLVSGGQDGTVRLWRMTPEGAGPGPQFSGLGYRGISSVTFSPNGEWLVFGAASGNVCIWKMSAEGPANAPCATGQQRHPVTKVLFSPKGRWLLTGSIPYEQDNDRSGKSVYLWDASTGFPLRGPTALFHVGNITEDALEAVAFSADESRLAVAYGYDAQVWDLTQQNPPQHILRRGNQSQWIKAVGFSPDNRWLATGSIDTNVDLWDLTSINAEPITLKGHSATVRSVVFSDDGQWLATAGDDFTARLWDVRSPTIPSTLLRGQDKPIEQLLFSPGAAPEYLLTLGDDVNPRLFNVPDPQVDPIVLRGHIGGISSVAVSLDGQWIASSGKGDHKIIVRTIKNPRTPVRELDLMKTSAQGIAFSPSGRWIAAQDGGTTVHLWSFPSLSRELQMSNGGLFGPQPQSFGFSPDGRWLLSGTWQPPAVNMWDVSADNPSATPRFKCSQDYPVRELAFSTDGRYAISGSHGFQAYIWDLRASDVCASRRLLGRHGDVVSGVAISPNSRWAATASFDKFGRLWDLKSGALVAQIPFTDRVMEVTFSPDSGSVAFGSWDKTIQLVDLTDPRSSKPVLFPGHNGRVFGVAFSPDSRWLATSGEDRTIRLWDRTDPTVAPLVLRHDESVSYTSFSKDGRWLISAGEDATVRLWRLVYSDLVNIVCQTAGRQLTATERSTYLPDDSSDHELPCTDQPRLP